MTEITVDSMFQRTFKTYLTSPAEASTDPVPCTSERKHTQCVNEQRGNERKKILKDEMTANEKQIKLCVCFQLK